MTKFKLGLLVYDTSHCDILDFYADKLDTVYFNSDGNLCTGDKIFDKTKEEPYRPLRIDLNAIEKILRLLYLETKRLVYNPLIKLKVDKRIILDLLYKGHIEFLHYGVDELNE